MLIRFISGSLLLLFMMSCAGQARTSGGVAPTDAIKQVKIALSKERPSQYVVVMTKPYVKPTAFTKNRAEIAISKTITEIEEGLKIRLPEMLAKEGLEVVSEHQKETPQLTLTLIGLSANCSPENECWSLFDLKGILQNQDGKTIWDFKIKYGFTEKPKTSFEFFADNLIKALKKDNVISVQK